jgi:two-component system, NtrC family, sensor histidine kinase PilS
VASLPLEDDLRRKIRWLTGLRLLVVTAVLSASVLYQMTDSRVTGSIPLLYGMIAFVYGLTIFYGLLLRTGMNLTSLAYLQIGVDVFFETALVYFSGGIESPLSFLYILSVISAGMILYKRGAVLTASLASILYGGIVDLQYYGLLPGLSPAGVSIGEAIYIPFLNIVAFFTVAMLSGGLSEQLRRTGERLRETGRGLGDLRALHDNIVQSISSGLFTTDLGGRLTSFNRAASEIAGYTSSEVLGRPCWEIFDWTEIRSLFRPLLEFSGGYRFDQYAKTKRGRTIPVGVTLSLLRDNEGIVIGLGGIFQDLTRVREMEEVVRRNERLASIGEMAAGMAHEIRNPLASISGSMQFLSRELVLGGEYKHLMDIALKETDRLNGIISDFLYYARPRPLERRPCDVCGLLTETLGLARMSREFRDSIEIRCA